MSKFLLVGIILAVLQCVISVPQHLRLQGRHLHQHKDRNEKTAESDSGDDGKVIWGEKCSARYAMLYSTQDTILECEVRVPVGTVLSWYKGTTPYHPQAELVEEATNEIDWKDPVVLPNGHSASEIHLSSIIYVDCTSADDAGDYTLQVKTPKGSIHQRSFTVIIIDSGYHSPGATCGLSKSLISYFPRIYLYAKQVLAYRGYDIIIPCRSQGHDISQSWHFQNRQIATGSTSKYEVLASGDLIVRGVTLADRGIYICRVSSNVISGLTDETLTYFFPHPQDSSVV